MSEPHASPPDRVGLCATCVHQRVVRTTRGSSFSLCERSRAQPKYPRYPRLPVLRCEGHEIPSSRTLQAGWDS